jgi:hypothetical protein
LATCLVIELGADVDRANSEGCTALWLAAGKGRLDLVRELLKLKADINHASKTGVTPLMIASNRKNEEVVTWLVKAGADTQATMPGFDDTAADVSGSSTGGGFTTADFLRQVSASTSQTAYLEAKTHCSNPGCSGGGLKKCPACKQARYCGEPCQLAHWKAHKADCKRWSAELAAGKGKGKSSVVQ